MEPRRDRRAWTRPALEAVSPGTGWNRQRRTHGARRRLALVATLCADARARRLFFRSLVGTEIPPDCEVTCRVVDSDPADRDDRLPSALTRIGRRFGSEVVHSRADPSLGRDAALFAACQEALEEEPDWICTLDGALLLHPRWLSAALKALSRLEIRDGEPLALGVYNSPRHEGLGPWIDGVEEKRSVGTTCTLYRAGLFRDPTLRGSKAVAASDLLETRLNQLIDARGGRLAALSPCFAQRTLLDATDRGAIPDFAEDFAGASYAIRRFARVLTGRDDSSPPEAPERLAHYDAERERRLAELRRLASDRAREGVCLVMVANRGFLDIFENWVRSCDRHGVEVRSWSLFFAADAEAAARAEALGFRARFDPGSYGELPSQAAGKYADGAFRRIMFLKSAAVLDALDLGHDVLFQDVDMVWRRDPLPWLLDPSRHHLDALFMDDGPNPNFVPFHANTGFFLLRNRPAVRAFWRDVVERHQQVLDDGSQQLVVNERLAVSPLALGILPSDLFANGHLWSIDPESRLPQDPLVVHCSWTHNLEHKLEKYRLHGLWYMDDAAGS